MSSSRAAQKKKEQLAAQAIIEQRKREGTWEGAVQPLTRYQGRIFDFAEDILGIPKHTLIWSMAPGYSEREAVDLEYGITIPAEYDGTPDPIAELGRAVEDGQHVAVESGTGTGKSFFCAVGVLYFLACYKNGRVFTLAPKEDQLADYIWKEIDDLWPKFELHFPGAEKTHLRIRMIAGKKGWDAQARTVGVGADEWSATKARGMHAEHMMIICEEATGIHQAVMTAVQQTCTAPHNFIVAVGNPDHQFDGLHQFAIKDRVKHIIASSLDHPNVVTGDASIVPGAVSREFLVDRAEDEPPGSRIWEAHVRGRSPSESTEALIKREWVEAAQQRWFDNPELRDGLPALGVDVANSENGDKGAIAEGVGACLLSVESMPCPDANAFGRNQVLPRMVTAEPRIRARHVGVDAVGVGAGTVNELKRLGHRVKALGSGKNAHRRSDPEDRWEENEEGEEVRARRIVEEEVYQDLRAQMWWRMRKDLQHGRIALPQDEELLRDLIAPEWKRRNGKIVVEPKDSIRPRIGRSTDKGDAVVYWNWVRSRRKIREQHEEKVDPNEDTFFDDHIERLGEMYDFDRDQSSGLKRNVGALKRSER